MSTATIVLDTHKVIKALQERGFSADQAEGIADTLREIDLSEVATKADIQGVEKSLQAMEMRMIKWTFGMLIAQAALIIAIIELL